MSLYEIECQLNDSRVITTRSIFCKLVLDQYPHVVIENDRFIVYRDKTQFSKIMELSFSYNCRGIKSIVTQIINHNPS